MSADIAQIGAGFAAPPFDSQRVFRAALDALSHPGTVLSVDADAAWPDGMHPAAGALLLSLLDPDTGLWIQASTALQAAPYLRFHTGCTLADSPGQADFAYVANASEMPPLDAFACGSDEHPHRSATVIVQVERFESNGRWRCTGPGVDAAHPPCIALDGMPHGFAAAWNRQRHSFPCGIDLYLTAGDRLIGLPRTTQLTDAAG